MTVTKKDFERLAADQTLEFVFADLRKIYAAMWADCQDKKEREYLWFKQAAIDELKSEILRLAKDGL